MKSKRIIALLALLGCTSMLFTGCGGNKETEEINRQAVMDDNVTAAGELPVVKEKITLTIGVPGSSFVEDYETNEYTKFLEEKTGIDLEFYEFPSSGGSEKLNVMLSSNTELPDIICGFNLGKGTFLQYADQGVFVDLTDYMDKYGYWIKEMEKQSAVKNFNSWLTAADNGKYYMPSAAEQVGNRYGGKAFINKAWLDKLGLDMPKTTEDFAKVMEAFVTQDPNGNGKNDEIGFTGSKNGWNEKPVNFLMNSFVYDNYSDGLFVDENGKISLNYLTDEYKKGLEYIADLAKKKALDVQCYTQDNNTLRSLCASEDVIIGAFASGGPDGLFVDDMTRLADYVPLPPLEGPDGTAYAYFNAPRLQCNGVITKYCEHPAAAFRLLDFMLSEEASLFARYGVEGKDWKLVDESVPCMFENIGFKSKIMQLTAYSAAQNSNWHQFNPYYLNEENSNSFAWSGDEFDGEYIKAKALDAYIGKEPEKVITSAMLNFTIEEQDEYNEIYTQIKEYVNESVSLFVSGTYNFDSDWDTFQESLKNLNVDRYLELLQIGYDAFVNNN